MYEVNSTKSLVCLYFLRLNKMNFVNFIFVKIKGSKILVPKLKDYFFPIHKIKIHNFHKNKWVVGRGNWLKSEPPVFSFVIFGSERNL
jgi:hypothetical protein